MRGTDMGCELPFALPLVVLLHFIERFANRCSRRIEDPCAFGATPTTKTLFADPHEFAAHGLPSSPRSGYASVKEGVASVFPSATAKTRAGTHIKNRTEYNKVREITDSEGRLSVGYATLARVTISIQGHPRTV
jgi:hypothetical protein